MGKAQCRPTGASSSGSCYYRSRYYRPGMARFISEDPIGLWGGINTYAYVGGNLGVLADGAVDVAVGGARRVAPAGAEQQDDANGGGKGEGRQSAGGGLAWWWETGMRFITH